jgi:hypothetical protein
MSERADGRARFDELAPEYLARPEVAISRMFGSEALSVRGKMFAFAANDGCLVVKLPEDRIAELQLDNMVMRGRPMREWAKVPLGAGLERWRDIADQAHAFVDSITPTTQ